MKDTLDPELIYDAFSSYGFPVSRIDHFDRGNHAKIRTDLPYGDYIDLNQLLEIATKLKLIEKNENIDIRIVNIDLIHKSMRVDIFIRE